jgi:hypothetical protein
VAATPMQLALARGHRWLAMLESGEAKSITELAAREKIDNSYMCRMLNLTTLAPDIVAAILDESLPPHVTVHELAISPPVLWEEQRERIGGLAGILIYEGRWPHVSPCCLSARPECSKAQTVAYRAHEEARGKT